MQSFSRGQRCPLESLGFGAAPSGLTVGVALEISAAPDIDICCFGLDAAGKLSDERYFVFFNQPASPCGAIKLLGAGDGFRQRFAIDLARLPATIARLVFTATVEGAATMRQITSGSVQLSGPGAEGATFAVRGEDYANEKALMLVELYQKNGWRFATPGQGFDAGLPGLIEHFGGEVAAPPPPAPPAAPPSAPPPVPPPAPPPVAAPPPPPVAAPSPSLSLKKLTLDKPGAKKTISLDKGGASPVIRCNLNWDRAVKKSFFGGGKEADLDLGCLFQLRDGEKGCIQALGGNFGSRDRPPFIHLDKDDRSGAAGDGENLHILRPDLIEKVLVFAFIYEGVANFSNVNGRLTLHESDGSETLIQLNSPRAGLGFCAICLIVRTASGVEVIKEESYFSGHRDADQKYGFGFNWTRGSK